MFDKETVNGTLCIRTDQKLWSWAFREGAEIAGFMGECDLDLVRLPAFIKSPSTCFYDRVWDKKNPRGRERFEAIREGTSLTFYVTILSSQEPGGHQLIVQRPPTREEIMDAFRIIGEHIGLSPFGSKFGYGRFVVTEQTNESEDLHKA
ncbi:MAG: hypothetical protein RR382_00170 [Tannerellaceae bacterium]